jgi:replicative DNA helicase
MIDKETLKESQVCLIGYLLENIKDIDTLSITKEYLKDFTVQGEKYNFKYIFERIEQIHKENRDNELLLELVNDELIGKDKLVQLVNGNTFEKLASIKEMERIIIQAHKEDLLKEAYNKLKNGECDINKYAETVKQINQLGTVKQENITEEDLKKCLNSDNKTIKGLGLPRLEACLKMKEHDFMVISASGTGGGKTALALNMLSELSKHYQCVYFNMEMAEEDIKERLISIQSAVPMKTLERYKHITDKELKNKIDEAMKEIGERKRIDIHTGAKSLEAIKATINRMDPEEHIIVFIDHIGMIRGFSRSSLYEKTTEIAKTLRAMALNHNITMIALSQVSRQQNQQGNTRNRENEAPTLSRLKESGEIENSARQVIFIYFKTEDNYFIRIAKNTRGQVDIDIPITFTKNTMTIREVRE